MSIFSRRETTVSDGIEIASMAEDRLKFERLYTVRLNERATMKIRMHWFIGGIMAHGELTQPNGRWVLFEPERPADKILDPALLPLIDAQLQKIFTMDRKYRNPEPNSFVDESGTKWVKA